MSEPLRVGIIGSGMMGAEHIGNIAAIADAEVTAIADPDERSRSATLEATGLAPDHAFVDHRDLIASGLCDAVVVATPNNTHVDVLLDVLGTDLHVLSEKPLCTTLEDCRRVVAAAETHDGVAWMGLEYRYMAPTAEMIRRTRAGTIGDVHMIAIREHRYPFLAKVENWNRFRANTGGTLVEKCCHFFDLMNVIADSDPVRVFATGSQAVNHIAEVYDQGVPDIIDNAYVVVEYANDVRAMLDLCMFAEGSKNEQEIAVTGSTGKIEAHLIPDSIILTGDRATGAVVEEVVVDDRVKFAGGHAGSSYLQDLEYVEAARNHTSPRVTLADGLRAVAIGIAAHRSIDTGQVVEMSEIL
jgi:predicted dehydrogenase